MLRTEESKTAQLQESFSSKTEHYNYPSGVNYSYSHRRNNKSQTPPGWRGTVLETSLRRIIPRLKSPWKEKIKESAYKKTALFRFARTKRRGE